MLLEPGFLIVQTLNGLQLSMLLFLLSIGLSVVFGMMNFINLAHGTLYMVGAYLALSTVRWFDSFWVALALAPLGVALIGALFYAVLLRHMQRQSPMRQVLVTFGLIFVGFDAVRMVWGVLPHTIPVPEALAGRVYVLGEVYPAYRLFIIAIGLAVLAALYAGLERTRLGAVVRASTTGPWSRHWASTSNGRSSSCSASGAGSRGSREWSPPRCSRSFRAWTCPS